MARILNIMKRCLQLGSLVSLCLLLIQCSSSGGEDQPGENSLVTAEEAYSFWPNESTTDLTSSKIVSKVLISDLNFDGLLENIFVSALPNSSNKKTSMLRITQGSDYEEITNYSTGRVALLQNSIPYTEDLDNDGMKELIFVGFYLDQVYSFEFKKDDLRKLFVRWTAHLPYPLEKDFSRQLMKITYKGKEMIKVGPFGIYESKNKKAKVLDLSTEDDSD